MDNQDIKPEHQKVTIVAQIKSKNNKKKKRKTGQSETKKEFLIVSICFPSIRD